MKIRIIVQISSHSTSEARDACSNSVTEVEIEGVGTYRLPNQWQGLRLKRLRGDERHTAVLALGCGMTVRQFNKLPSESRSRCIGPI